MHKIIELAKCQNCSRLVDTRKMPLHSMMCRTAHLRQSRSMPINTDNFQNWSISPTRHKPTKIMMMRQQKPLKQCTFCMEDYQEQEYNYHINLACKHRLVPCIQCDDMFPLSLFTEHLEQCRGWKQRCRMKQEEQLKVNESESSVMNALVTGISSFGASLFNKGVQAVGYCAELVQQNRAPVLLYLQSFRSGVQDAFQDLFQDMAYQQNIEGMPRAYIRKIQLGNYKSITNPNSQPQQHQHSSQQPQQQQVCTICFCELQDQQVIKILRCKHIYHPSCIDKWLRINRTCPLCKMDQMEQIQ